MRFTVHSNMAACGHDVEGLLNDDDPCSYIWDNLLNLFVDADGGEPEDQLLIRDWSWVADKLNEVHNESDNLRDRCDKMRDEIMSLKSQLNWVKRLVPRDCSYCEHFKGTCPPSCRLIGGYPDFVIRTK